MKYKRNKINRIPIDLPKELIYRRLGYKDGVTKLSSEHLRTIETAMIRGFSLCQPSGIWARIPIVARSESFVELENGDRFNSVSLARLLAKSHDLLLIATTVGEKVVEAISSRMQDGDGMQGLVYDATGSIVADQSLNWIHKSLGRGLLGHGEQITKARFSPGYGDLDLSNQKIIFNILQLQELGLSLSEKLILCPEKSVTAIAGIENNN